ncbi:MAG TPA: transglutaminaseTgpA domain-containing protein [Planctomycetota bacterium]|nr:transglutaminaseTgpA domain-containing protein [Planctomycetota bacterium]
MTDSLFPMLLVLTMFDLAFVHITDAVPGSGLLPLWLLAAGSPWLRRMQRYTSYRVIWNLCVVVVFAMLVNHASTTGLLHMLEDGLLLAVLCQVHLLNNVNDAQRPDLVFFNSFLIAFVTSFFSSDLVWSVLFVLHSLAFVPALQIHVLAQRRLALGRHLTFSLIRDGMRRTVVVGIVTAIVFVAWPRNFHREGWLGGTFMLREEFAAGLAEEIRLDREHRVFLSNEVVMVLEPPSGQAEDVPTHWRATAFSEFDGSSWHPQDLTYFGSRASDPMWERQPDGSWDRDLPPGNGVVRVRLIDFTARRLLCPLESRSIRMGRGEGLAFDPQPYGVLAFVQPDDASGQSIAYTVQLGANSGITRASARARERLTSLPKSRVPACLQELAARLRAQAPPAADDAAIARASCAWLQQHRHYQLPGEPGFAGDIESFLLGTGAGHCEYFATALALVLRQQGIPCRLVGGFLAHEWDPQMKAVVARARHAHAWVEALMRDGSWITLDPTPAADVMQDRTAHVTWWRAVTSELERLWQEVTDFDGDKRTAWLHGLVSMPVNHPFWTAGAALACFALFWLARRRQRVLPAIGRLQRAMRAAGLSLRAGETPRELLVRAGSAQLAPGRLEALQAAALEHESLRYSSAATAED